MTTPLRRFRGAEVQLIAVTEVDAAVGDARGVLAQVLFHAIDPTGRSSSPSFGVHPAGAVKLVVDSSSKSWNLSGRQGTAAPTAAGALVMILFSTAQPRSAGLVDGGAAGAAGAGAAPPPARRRRRSREPRCRSRWLAAADRQPVKSTVEERLPGALRSSPVIAAQITNQARFISDLHSRRSPSTAFGCGRSGRTLPGITALTGRWNWRLISCSSPTLLRRKLSTIGLSMTSVIGLSFSHTTVVALNAGRTWFSRPSCGSPGRCGLEVVWFFAPPITGRNPIHVAANGSGGSR